MRCVWMIVRFECAVARLCDGVTVWALQRMWPGWSPIWKTYNRWRLCRLYPNCWRPPRVCFQSPLLICTVSQKHYTKHIATSRVRLFWIPTTKNETERYHTPAPEEYDLCTWRKDKTAQLVCATDEHGTNTISTHFHIGQVHQHQANAGTTEHQHQANTELYWTARWRNSQ